MFDVILCGENGTERAFITKSLQGGVAACFNSTWEQNSGL